MRSRTTKRFRKAFRRLPPELQQQAREAYRRFRDNPDHPSLRFKQVHPRMPIHSVRITRNYRALAVREEDELIWFWIGSHAAYEKLLSRD